MPEEINNTAGAMSATRTGAKSAAEAGDQPQTAANSTPPPFDEWLAAQDETTKALVAQRFTALENTVRATRTEREELARQLREATKKLQEGSEARNALEALSARLQVAETRATFYEEAAKPEIGCTNARLAFLGAQEIGGIDDKGRVNWDAVRAAFPELFRPRVPPGNAGAGTGATPPGKMDMNTYIRRMAGRG